MLERNDGSVAGLAACRCPTAPPAPSRTSRYENVERALRERNEALENRRTR